MSGVRVDSILFPDGSEQITAPSDGALSSWSGFHSPSVYWSTTSSSFIDPTPSSTPAVLTEKTNVAFGSVVTAASDLPGIVFNPVSGAIYSITLTCGLFITTSGNVVSAQLTDGTTVIGGAEGYGVSTNAGDWVSINGIYQAPSSSPVTLKLQLCCNGGTSYIESFSGSQVPCIQWTLIKIG